MKQPWVYMCSPSRSPLPPPSPPDPSRSTAHFCFRFFTSQRMESLISDLDLEEENSACYRYSHTQKSPTLVEMCVFRWVYLYGVKLRTSVLYSIVVIDCFLMNGCLDP